MELLFLSCPSENWIATGGSANEPDDVRTALRGLQETVQQLRTALSTLLTASRSTSKEARLWLVNSIAGLELADAPTRRRRFTQFLPGGAACRGREHEPLGRALLELLFDAAPEEVGALIAEDASLLRRFFRDDPKRVAPWFGHFSMEGMRRFRLGAAALAHYSLAHRAEMWDLLAWQGRHPQAPVAVAQRSHYFCELDVPRTLRHLIRDCPDFWSSRELRLSVEAGAAQLLALDAHFWSKELMRWLEDRGSGRGDRLYALLCRCLEAGPWRQHCQRLLHLLPQPDLLPFAEDLLGSGGTPPVSTDADQHRAASCGSSGGKHEQRVVGGGSSRSWPAGGAGEHASQQPQPGAWLVFRGARWQSLDQLVLAAALGCCLPLLLRLLREEEMAGERAEVERLVRRLLGLDLPQPTQAAAVAAHWRLRQQLRAQRQEAAGASAQAQADTQLRDLLLLHLLASAFTVQQLCGSGAPGDAERLQQLLSASGFACQLIEGGEPGGSGGKKRKAHGRERKHKKGKKKRRRRHSSPGSDSSDSSDSDGVGELLDRQQHAWLAGGGGFSDDAVSAQKPLRWQLGTSAASSSGSRPEVSSFELLDAVIRTVGAAHANWLFS